VAPTVLVDLARVALDDDLGILTHGPSAQNFFVGIC
jgi:hypothetical protein